LSLHPGVKLVSLVERGTQAEGVRKQGAGEGVWVLWGEGGSKRRLEIIALCGPSCFVLLTKCCSTDHIKGDKVWGAYGTYGGEEKRTRSFGEET
jgi:hypothetical protein